MASRSSNRAAVPEAKGALDKFKYEVANELGVPLTDGYNGDLTGEKAATLGVNCGMSTGRNGVLTAFAANQRDEVRDLHDVAAALTAQPGMKQQTFVAGITAKGNGDCFLSEERHTALSGGGGMPGQGYPAIFTAAFSAGAGASAGSIGYGEEVSPTLKGTASGNCMPSILCLNDQGGSAIACSENVAGTLRHRSMATSHLYSRTTGSMPATPAHILWRPQCQPLRYGWEQCPAGRRTGHDILYHRKCH